MSKYYFTFCDDHPTYKNTICIVEAESYEAARDKFVNKFGTRFAFQYTQKEVDNWPNEDWYKYSPKQTFVEIDKLPYVNSNPDKED